MRSFVCSLAVFIASLAAVVAVRDSNNDLEFGYFHLAERRRTKEAKAAMGMKAGKNKTTKAKTPKKARTCVNMRSSKKKIAVRTSLTNRFVCVHSAGISPTIFS